MSPTLSSLSCESSKSFIKKTPLTETVNELFLMLHFAVKHGRSVLATVQQQMYCASNLEKGGVQVPAPSVLRKAILWNNSRNYWRNAGETLTIILAWWKGRRKVAMISKRLTRYLMRRLLHLFLLVITSIIVSGSLVWISLYKFKWNRRKRTSMQLRHIILIWYMISNKHWSLK